MSGDDVRMLQLSDGPHFSFKSIDRTRIAQSPGRKHLQCDNFLKLGMNRLVDCSHSSLAQLGEQFVLAQHSEWQVWLSWLISSGTDPRLFDRIHQFRGAIDGLLAIGLISKWVR